MPTWLWVLIGVLLIVWVVGGVAFPLGGLVNILLAVALILLIIWLVQRIQKP